MQHEWRLGSAYSLAAFSSTIHIPLFSWSNHLHRPFTDAVREAAKFFECFSSEYMKKLPSFRFNH